MHDNDAREIDWYELDSGAIVAVVLSGGPSGLFILPVNATSWGWYPVDTDGWDAAHQRIFRQHRADRLGKAPAHVPPLPMSVPALLPIDRDDLGAMGANASLMKWVAAAPSLNRTAFVVLEEDSYESAVGDGVFRDFIGCFPTEDAALHCDIEPGMQRHVRRIELSLDEGRITARAERQDFADRYDFDSALADLARRFD
jgi:hypothetical protein